MIKKLIKEILIIFRANRGGWRQCRHLNAVDVIIDVGVASGTPDLYREFPNARYLLVDPLDETISMLKHVPKDYVFFNYALGNSKGKINLNIPEKKSRSSILKRFESFERYDMREVNLITGSELIEMADIKSGMKIGLKIDTEGSELGVLMGFGRHLKSFSWIIIECSTKKRFEGQSNFQDINKFITDMGFSLTHILNASIDNFGNIPYIDVAYENNIF